MSSNDHPKTIAKEASFGYDRKTIDYIRNAAAHGLYEIRGMGAKRQLPNFDDLVFLGEKGIGKFLAAQPGRAGVVLIAACAHG